MALVAGAKLGPYEILAPIGAGGMGEVFRARDLRVNREVAIKRCSSQFTERFSSEARAIAALNHTNICPSVRRRPRLLGHGIRGRGNACRPASNPRSASHPLSIDRRHRGGARK